MNIQEILTELKASGMSYKEIAAEIGAPHNSVIRIKNGAVKGTSFERGMKIYELAKKRLPDMS
jgi:ribosome-binding protein aMBF1 (putative translation factor)